MRNLVTLEMENFQELVDKHFTSACTRAWRRDHEPWDYYREMLMERALELYIEDRKDIYDAFKIAEDDLVSLWQNSEDDPPGYVWGSRVMFWGWGHGVVREPHTLKAVFFRDSDN